MEGKKRWFELIKEIHSLTGSVLLPCMESCDGRCEETGEETVLFLPYELEYILEKWGILKNPFDLVEIDRVVYGTMGYLRSYSCLSQNKCLIHPFRPFDCRSFPILPKFREKGIDFFLAEYCPLKFSLPSEFISIVTSCWNLLEGELPPSWKSHYNSLCRYTLSLNSIY